MENIMALKRYEVEQYKRAFTEGTDAAWKRYKTNVKRAVNRFNREHAEQIDIDALMA